MINFGNDFQALWHVMAEALRIKNSSLFSTTAHRLKRHIEVTWDDVYEGVLNVLTNVEENRWRLSKAHYVQVEPLIGLLSVIEHTGASWAKDWFAKIYHYERENFHLKKYGYPLWLNSADRKVTFDYKRSTRIGNFHQPRHFLLSLVSIKRIIKRGGKISSFVT